MTKKIKRFQMDAYRGATIDSMFFGKLVFDVSGIRTPAGAMPALREHDRLRPIGVIDKTAKTENKLEAFGFFIDSEDSIVVQKQLSELFPIQASIGVWLDEIEVLQKNESAIVNAAKFDGDVIVRKSFVREISAVVLGADSDTQVKALSLGAGDEFLDDAILMTQQPQLKKEWRPNTGPAAKPSETLTGGNPARKKLPESADLEAVRLAWRPMCGPLA